MTRTAAGSASTGTGQDAVRARWCTLRSAPASAPASSSAGRRPAGRALLTVIRILDPDRIVLGGGVALAGSVLLDPVRDTMREFGSPSIGYSTEIVLAELENYSPLYGAAAMALDLAGQPETESTA